jgi:hypothetical protein
MTALTNELRNLPADKPIVLKNLTCPYCGSELDKKTNTKEHVVGRRFVPKGSLSQKWNLILRACNICNNKKSSLEDDISAISMQPNVHGKYPSNHHLLLAEAQRKAKHSFSKTTKKLVSESQANLKVAGTFMGGEMKIELIAPPQIDEIRAFELARLQITAFFYFITFDHSANIGHFWPGE